jgi:TPP-dependent pyruvate/acetoin dehydrogenase alpha subunit
MREDDRCSLFRMMSLIRHCETAIGTLVERAQTQTPCHLSIGQEAVAVGVCSVLEQADQIWGNHRSHGHYLAKGGDLLDLLREVLCRASGCAQGRGGSMHICAPALGILGTVPIVGGTVSMAVGAGLAFRQRRLAQVAVAFFGDGTLEEGQVHESMNLAALYDLPVIFICENNLYSSHMHISERRRRDNLVEAGSYHGMPGVVVDGNNVQAVQAATSEARALALAGQGPSFIEARTFRWRGHVGHRMDVDVGVKRRDELEAWFQRDPIRRERERLIAGGVDAATLDHLDAGILAEVETALATALAEPQPDPSTLLDHVFVGP